MSINTLDTNNLVLASVLHYSRCKLVGMDKANPRRSVFQFAYTTQCQELISAFWSSSLSVEPRAFFAAQKDLKSMLYDRSYQ